MDIYPFLATALFATVRAMRTNGTSAVARNVGRKIASGMGSGSETIVKRAARWSMSPALVTATNTMLGKERLMISSRTVLSVLSHALSSVGNSYAVRASRRMRLARDRFKGITTTTRSRWMFGGFVQATTVDDMSLLPNTGGKPLSAARTGR